MRYIAGNNFFNLGEELRNKLRERDLFHNIFSQII
jgi:hypothetical protein